ncbi:major facilitator superfamily transporter [Cadophora sp. MPI-SDFR-AT-0126]|nr:major facilitator superfamily transporter [Leotiomycetes sp. MPI-SDFR-AT-0126]
MTTIDDEEMASLPVNTTSVAPQRSTKSKYDSCDLSGSVFIISSDGKILNLPIPTKSAQDPLNWSKWKQARAFLALLIFTISADVLIQGPTYLTYVMRSEFHMENIISVPKLFMGIGALIWIPLSLAVGRRPVFLLCTVILFLSSLLASLITNFAQLLVASCFMGLVQGLSSSMALLMVIDITFIHQRPQAIAMIWCGVGAITATLLALIPRLVPKGSGESTWRLFYSSWAIASLLSVVLAFFFYPETYFVRPPVAFNGRVLIQSATEKVHVYEDWEEVPDGKALPETPNQSPWAGNLKFWGLTRGGWRAMRICYSQVLGCLLNPLIFWVAILNALVFTSMLSIKETYTDILINPRYKLSSDAFALIHMAGAIGCLIAWPVSGFMVSFVSCRLAKRNLGVRDAEHYLPAFILPILTGTANIIIYGVAVENRWHYMWIYFAYGLNSFTLVSLATANTLWVTEAFPRWAAPALAGISSVSNMTSFGISFAIPPWIRSQGHANADIEIGVLIAVVGCIAIPIAFWGKKMRQQIHDKWGMSEMGALRPQ